MNKYRTVYRVLRNKDCNDFNSELEYTIIPYDMNEMKTKIRRRGFPYWNIITPEIFDSLFFTREEAEKCFISLYTKQNQQRIIELKKEILELKKNTIAPKFKKEDYVYVIYSDENILKGQIDVFDYYTNRYFIFFGEDIGSDWFSENLLFTTKREAQKKLKENK